MKSKSSIASTPESAIKHFWTLLLNKWKDYMILVKLRLNLTVVFSAAIGYLLALGTQFQWLDLFMLSLAGFSVTSSANAINQILEKEYDKLMKRTANRPLATGRMQVSEAVFVAGITGVLGISLLWFWFNETAALLGALSLLSYAFIYTPLKRVSPIAVFVGAIPGALPPMIGWVAVSGVVSLEAWVLFCIQFLWQFPHFWAIGWIGAEEYAKAGYKLSPNLDQKNRYTAAQILFYIIVLIVVSLIPKLLGLVSIVSVISSLLLGFMFFYYGVRLFKECTDKAALQLMFASITYLPLMQIVMVVDRMLIV